MNVLVVASKYPPEYSGSGRRLHDLYKRLKARDGDLKWQVLSTRAEGLSIGIHDDITVWRVPGASSVNPRLPKGIRGLTEVLYGIREFLIALRFLNREAFHAVHVVHTCGWSWCVIAACYWSRRRKIPLIRELTSMHDHPFNRTWMRPLIRTTLRWATLIVAISPYLSERCRRGGLSGKVWCRPNPIDGRKFHPVSHAEKLCLRSQLFPELAAEEAVLLLNVGRIRPLKNQLILLDVLMRLPPLYRLVLAGPVSKFHRGYLEQIIRKIEELDLRGRVFIRIGDHQNPEQFMQAADIFLFPSTSEGLGTVMLEALMCGMPVIANPLEGITDSAVDHGSNGFLISFQDGRVIEAIHRAKLYSREQRKSIAQEAEGRFGTARIDERYHHYLEVLCHGG